MALLSTWALWRLVKFLGFAVLAGGVLGAISAHTRRVRLVMTYGYAVPGFVLTWAAGWMLMKATDRSPLDPWIFAAIAASVVSLHGIFLASHREQPRPISSLLALGGLLAAVAAMVIRVADPLRLLAALFAGAAIGAVAAWPLTKHPVTSSPDDANIVRRGFRWMAWAEGGSLLGMLCISMPLKYGLGWNLDGGTGLIGWVHGVLVIVYLQTLQSTARMFGWPRSWSAQGVVAAFIPGAPIVFDKWIDRRAAGGDALAAPREG